jgi:ribulose-bisphosphate carboxylase large chain
VIPATTLEISGSRFVAVYALAGTPDDARARAEAITVEQTIEFPADLIADDDIRAHVIGRIEAFTEVAPGRCEATISYAIETSGFEIPQLLNVLYGNCSLIPDVRLQHVTLPDDLLARFRGPRFGLRGLRELTGAPTRPLIASATKPQGLPPSGLAAMAARMAEGGLDVIKDDHGLSDQPFAPFRERVRATAEAVAEVNARTGSRALYLPSINGPADEIVERAHFAKDVGAGGLLVIPGEVGLDTLRRLADDDELALPLMAHPAFQGAFVVDARMGIEHGVLFGTLDRLAGADMTVFPGYGGRFSFSQAACRSIVDACSAPLAGLRPIVAAAGGGMTLDRLDELLSFYGRDSMLLIGGNLSRGDLLDNARQLREAVEAWDARHGAATP